MAKHINTKSSYLPNAMLVFNFLLKDIDTCTKECKLCNLEAVKYVKDHTSNNVRGVADFYLDTYSTWEYHKLFEHLKMSFEMGKTFSSLVSDFCSKLRITKELRYSSQLNCECLVGKSSAFA